MDYEVAFLGLARLGLCGIVLSVAITAFATMSIRNPEVGRSSIEVDREFLIIRSDGYGARPFRIIKLVGQWFPLPFDEGSRLRYVLDFSTFIESLTTDVTLKVDEVLAVFA